MKTPTRSEVVEALTNARNMTLEYLRNAPEAEPEREMKGDPVMMVVNGSGRGTLLFYHTIELVHGHLRDES